MLRRLRPSPDPVITPPPGAPPSPPPAPAQQTLNGGEAEAVKGRDKCDNVPAGRYRGRALAGGGTLRPSVWYGVAALTNPHPLTHI